MAYVLSLLGLRVAYVQGETFSGAWNRFAQVPVSDATIDSYRLSEAVILVSGGS